MDTDSMSFCYEEHFPTYESSHFFRGDDESECPDELFHNSSNVPYWDWEIEQEINGDIALIPMSSNVGMNYLSNSPPAREDFQKIMSEWQQFMNSEVSELDAFSSEMPLADMCDNILETEHHPVHKLNHASRISGKKMDLDAQCYIINEPSAEVQSEDDTNVIKKEVDNIVDSDFDESMEKTKVKVEDPDSENDFVDVDTVTDVTPILQAGDLNSLLEQFEATESYQPEAPVKIKEEFVPVKCEPENEYVDKSKQILEALPQELILKIKASSKRRVVPVIDAMPNKKRCKKIQNELGTTSTTIPTQDNVEKIVKTGFVQLDHDYCSQSTPYPKYPQKDSGFESAEEDEQRSILKKQPTFKGADGKLMVSLLKINTIRNSIVTDNNKTKRKLNLEEYKKRREGIIRVNTDSHDISPASSGANSPVVEDEQMRLLKHQKKLMQMAEEVLKTPPKSAALNVQNSVAESNPTPVIPASSPPKSPPRPLPSNIEVKTLVSIGVNTIITQVEHSELHDIKPILQSANTKINDNSLITSVIKNLQKVKPSVVPQTTNKQLKDQEHGEDKTIVYFDKCRPPIETRSIEVQTEPEVEDTTRHKRKRSSSIAAVVLPNKEFLTKEEANLTILTIVIVPDLVLHLPGKVFICFSFYRQLFLFDYNHAFVLHFRSRSRSRSPRRTYSKKHLKEIERERIKEVEERRIVYVGGISKSTTKESLRRRFQVFGPITNVSIHFRGYGDNYGFVTYMYKGDAYEAVEHGNDDPLLPKYDLSFGGRRIFCRTHYSDLDNMQDDKLYPSQVDDSFDNLLREAKAKLKKRKSCT
ncbi:hypothetical protein FQR65_LT06168 [Abscondita terminalis]|nr:hypothetical protein FQR65_LT06168 [Abscondita terminalis]